MSRLKRTPQEVRASSPWDWLLQESEREQRERVAYHEACTLDESGNYAEADEVLRAAGVADDVIDRRRAHIDWRRRQGFPAISGQ